jgi:uncharacterized protein (TIGR03067 family)
MSRTICRGVLCLIALVGVSVAVRADDKDEWKKLSGKWNIEKAVFMGQDSTEVFKTAKLTVEEGKYSVVFGDQEDKGTIKLDTAKKPKQMTIESTDGPNKGKTIMAIYEIDGDTCKICYALEGKDAPKEFESKEGTMTLYIVYKRDKK